MNIEELRDLKQVIVSIRMSMENLQKIFSQIDNEIKEDVLIPNQNFHMLTEALRICENHQEHLKQYSGELSIQQNMKLADIEIVLNEIEEENNKLSTIKSFLFDYLRLNTTNSNIIDELQKTKKDLLAICSENIFVASEALELYRLVIETIKDKEASLTAEDFNSLMNKFSLNFTLGVERKQFYIDESSEISENANIAISQLPFNKNDKAIPKFHGYIDVESSDIHMVDNFLKAELTTISELSFKERYILGRAADEGIVPLDTTEDVVSKLTELGLIMKVSLKEEEEISEFYVLTKKGWSCFELVYDEEKLHSQYPSMFLTKKLLNIYKWDNVAFVKRMLCLSKYYSSKNEHYITFVKGDGIAFCKSMQHPQLTTVAGLFPKGDMEDGIAEITKYLNNTTQYEILVILVKVFTDIEYFAGKIDTVNRKVLFCVEKENYGVFDDNGKMVNVALVVQNLYKQKSVLSGENSFTLDAVNSPKINTPSASKFKKEIVNLAKSNFAIAYILPLLTNLGILCRKQIVQFCVDLELENYKKIDTSRINCAVDLLVEKGYLTKYIFNKIEVFGLSSYCLGCMRKKEVSSMKLWLLSLGLNFISCDIKIDLNLVCKMLRTNQDLYVYLSYAKKKLDEKDYQTTIQSIKWTDAGYQMVYFSKEQKIMCILNPNIKNYDMLSDKNVLLTKGFKHKAKKYSEYCNDVILFDNETIEQ